jgi:hypothetical protein
MSVSLINLKAGHKTRKRIFSPVFFVLEHTFPVGSFQAILRELIPGMMNFPDSC